VIYCKWTGVHYSTIFCIEENPPHNLVACWMVVVAIVGPVVEVVVDYNKLEVVGDIVSMIDWKGLVVMGLVVVN